MDEMFSIEKIRYLETISIELALAHKCNLLECYMAFSTLSKACKAQLEANAEDVAKARKAFEKIEEIQEEEVKSLL